jgi:hypothetical protein
LGDCAGEGAEVSGIGKLKRFVGDRRGIVAVGVLAIVFIISSSLVWLVGALIVNRTFDALTPYFSGADPRGLLAASNAVNVYGVVIVVVDVLLLVWWGISAQRVESEESPVDVVF